VIVGVNKDVVVSGPYVDFRKILHIAKSDNQFGDQGKWVGVLDSPFIDVMIILTGA